MVGIGLDLFDETPFIPFEVICEVYGAACHEVCMSVETEVEDEG